MPSTFLRPLLSLPKLALARSFAMAAASTSSTAAPARAQLLPASSPADLECSLETASSFLRQNRPVAFPTETVYGLGASALSPEAVKTIFDAKGRPSDNPLIVHVGSREMLEGLLPHRRAGGEKEKGAAEIPRMYEALMDRFWPGALSLVFPLPHLADPKGKGKAVDPSSYDPPRLPVAPAVTAGHPSLCIRMPSHPLALRLIQVSDLPLAAPSANLSSRPSPTTAAHVMHDLGEGRGLAAVLDGGECEVGVESTVVDWVPPAEGEAGQEGALRILRAGGVSAEDIEACLRDAGFGTFSSSAAGEGEKREGASGEKTTVQVYARDFRNASLEAAPTTPGMKYKHYAPSRAKVVLVKPVLRGASGSGDAGVDELGPTPSLQDLIQLTALTQARVRVDSEGRTVEERFRVGLMLTDETLEAVKAAPFSSSSSSSTPSVDSPAPTTPASAPSPTRIRLPPPPPSLFSSLSIGGDDNNLPDLASISLYSYPLGSQARPIEAAQRLFGGLRTFDELPLAEGEDNAAGLEEEEEQTGVDLILVECVKEDGVGLAVMERARKAAGGIERGGEMEILV